MATHHHHHYASTHYHHHHHHASSRRLSSLPTGPVTKENRGKFLASTILVAALIIAAATVFLVLVYTLMAAQSGFPKFVLIPFTIAPALMIVIAFVSLFRGIRIYRKVANQNEESRHADENDAFESENE